jgi:hypothetical protein
MSTYKKYIIEFTHQDGKVEEVELITDRIEWSIEQWKRNRAIVNHKIIKEESSNQNNNQQMLFG